MVTDDNDGGGNVAEKIRTESAKADRQFDERLQNDPRFLRRIAQARESIRAGRGVRLEDVEPK